MITTRKLAHKDELNFSQAVDAGPLAGYLVVAVSFRDNLEVIFCEQRPQLCQDVDNTLRIKSGAI
ncbi:MAG: hypothetical protein SXV54_04075 [Chloroflexota bacterium]|nr:hypothetical protein [Chloroflexota bacterium]